MTQARPSFAAVLWLLPALLPAQTPTVARSNTSGFTIGIHALGSALSYPDTDTESGGGIGGRIGVGINSRISLHLGVDYAQMSPKEAGLVGEDYGFAHVDLAMRFSLRDSTVAFRPYIEGGITGRGVSATVQGSDLTLRGGAGTAGLGFQYFASRRTAFDVGLLASYGKFTDATVDGEDVSLDDAENNWSSRFTVGLRWFLGR